MELCVPIGMARPLPSLAIGLQRIIELVQEFAHKGAADLMAHGAQRFAELAQALAGPQQRRLRVAARCRLDQRAQIVDEFRIGFARRLAAAARPAHARHIDHFAAAIPPCPAVTPRLPQTVAGRARQARDQAPQIAGG